MPTIAERETLIAQTTPKRSGFTPRPAENFATRKVPQSVLNVECNHFLRCSSEDTTHGYSPLPHKMWMDAGRHHPPYPERPDPNYNSNVWRNFSKQYGFRPHTEGAGISEMIAGVYPLNIPPPSKVGDYTYAKFLKETPLIKDEKLRKMAIERTYKDVLEFKRLRLKSEARHPPMDQSGNIAPPVNFKHYVHKFIPPELPPATPDDESREDLRVDIFGKLVPKPKHTGPYLWKVSYKLNNPEYRKVKQEIELRREASPRHPPPMIITQTQAKAQ